MKTKLLILTIALFIFFFKISSLAKADYSCSYYNLDNPSDSGSYTSCSDSSGYDAGSDDVISCSGTPCPAPTDTPPSSGGNNGGNGGTCVNAGGFFSGPAGTFPCCGSLVECPDGTCESSCGGGGTQICSPGAIQYVCSTSTCNQ